VEPLPALPIALPGGTRCNVQPRNNLLSLAQLTMNRVLDRQEQEQVRTARAHFFSTQKRKDEPPESTPTSTSETSLPSNKRFKMAHHQTTPAEKSKSQPIVRFYDPDLKARDAFGRTQEQILLWTDSKLESSHNYIQVLFPLPEGSPFNSEVGFTFKRHPVNSERDFEIGEASVFDGDLSGFFWSAPFFWTFH
jgi:hypothetical protein